MAISMLIKMPFPGRDVRRFQMRPWRENKRACATVLSSGVRGGFGCTLSGNGRKGCVSAGSRDQKVPYLAGIFVPSENEKQAGVMWSWGKGHGSSAARQHIPIQRRNLAAPPPQDPTLAPLVPNPNELVSSLPPVRPRPPPFKSHHSSPGVVCDYITHTASGHQSRPERTQDGLIIPDGGAISPPGDLRAVRRASLH